MPETTRHPKTRLLLRASKGGGRRVLAYLAMLATVVGFARSAFPVLTHGTGRPAYTIAADDSGPAINAARLPRTGLRRAALLLGPALPDLNETPTASGDDEARRFERGLLVPRSVPPTPPFRPPRRV